MICFKCGCKEHNIYQCTKQTSEFFYSQPAMLSQ